MRSDRLTADAGILLLDSADLARIDSYVGGGAELHELLPAVAPLARAVWYEATVTAQHGTRMILRYGAAPAPDGIDVNFRAMVEDGPVIAECGPARVTRHGMDRPPGVTDEHWRELRAAAGIVLRALLLL